jgi:hypothetical protein
LRRLGESGVSFFGLEKLAKRFQRNSPYSLDQSPMLLPMTMCSLRGQRLKGSFLSLIPNNLLVLAKATQITL